tara:strand:+ start:106 stop:471 length:366 start_codon:yes stop_codon:yes gene_type:complete
MYKYQAKALRVIDGDTVDAMIDLGFKTWVKKRIRLVGINAFAYRTRDKEIKKKGVAAKKRLEEVLLENENDFVLTSYGVGKYGRCLGELFVVKNYIKSKKYKGKSINEMLIVEGHAVRYNP